jgi:hypothetical protein
MTDAIHKMFSVLDGSCYPLKKKEAGARPAQHRFGSPGRSDIAITVTKPVFSPANVAKTGEGPAGIFWPEGFRNLDASTTGNAPQNAGVRRSTGHISAAKIVSSILGPGDQKNRFWFISDLFPFERVTIVVSWIFLRGRWTLPGG